MNGDYVHNKNGSSKETLTTNNSDHLIMEYLNVPSFKLNMEFLEKNRN